MEPKPVKAKAKVIGANLVLIETEYGQKCVIPEHSVCEFLARYNIVIVEGYQAKCNTRTTGQATA